VKFHESHNIAHYVFSTTWRGLSSLHLNAENRFLGRLFGADLAISMFLLAAATWIAGQAIDHGVSPRAVAVGTGLAMFLPSGIWAMALRLCEVPVLDHPVPLSLR